MTEIALPSNLTLLQLNLTTRQYLRGAMDMTIRGRKLFAMLNGAGRIMTGQVGVQLEETMADTEPEVSGYTDGNEPVFGNHVPYQRLGFEYRQKIVTDSLLYSDYVKLGNESALTDVYSEKAQRIQAAMIRSITRSIHDNGQLGGDNFWGLPTFTSHDNGVAVTAADLIAIPGGTYRGLSVKPGDRTPSTWTQAMSTKPNAAFNYDWPFGNGSARFDSHSPLLWNSSCNRWNPAGGTTWRDNCLDILQTDATVTNNLGFDSNRIAITNASDLIAMKSKFMERYQVMNVWPTEEFGLPDILKFEKYAIIEDFDTPANTTYTIDMGGVQLLSQTPDLIDVQGPEYKMERLAFIMLVLCMANYKFKPRAVSKIFPYA